MNPIVAATDFSQGSLNAVRYGARLAADMKAAFHILHVCIIPLNYGEAPVLQATLDSIHREAEQNMASLQAELAGLGVGVPGLHTHILEGNAAEKIADYCEAVAAAAVIMGPERDTWVVRFMSGAHSFAALTKFRAPTFFVPATVTYSKPVRVGLACDLLDPAGTVPVDAIESLVRSLGAELHLLHVTHKGDSEHREGRDPQSEHLKAAFAAIPFHLHIIREHTVEKGLAQLTRDLGLDLIIVLPRQHSLLERLFSRTHSEKMILESPIPVLALHL
jgi:nucleotide-binding universal stress UspA family protein